MLTAFAEDSLSDPLEIASVTLMGSDTPIEWEVTEKGLSLLTPGEATDEMAVVFKIETR